MTRAIRGVVLLLVLAACGGSAGDDTTTSRAGGTTTVPSASTTSTSTTIAATTTPAADAHPVFGVSWASVFPEPGETAIYRVTRQDGSTVDLPAEFEYGVEFRGTILDRLVIGTAEPSNEGWVIYFDRSVPWVFAVVASEIYETETPGGPAFVHMFAEPVPFDGTMDVAEPFEVETTLTLEFAGGFADEMSVIYRIIPAAIDDTVTVPFGTVTDVLRLEAEVGGELIGTTFIDVTLWLHPDHTLVRFEGTPMWDLMELVETWG